MAKDTYLWGAVYTDGSLIGEYDRLEGRGFADVDAARVKELYIFPSASLPWKMHHVRIPSGATPVFFRRRSVAVNLTADEQQSHGTTHCIGWQRDGGEAVYLFVGDDGTTLLTDDLEAV